MKTTDDYVLFWGDEDIYSNFYPCEFTLNDHKYHWSEQAFMYLKAITFSDVEIAKEISEMHPDKNTPLQCKKLGRKIKNFNDMIWNNLSSEVMYNACYAKFSQNKLLSDQLLNTGNRIIVEASPYDKIWGIGLSETDPDALDKTKWKGQNLLGEVLMRVRSNLR